MINAEKYQKSKPITDKVSEQLKDFLSLLQNSYRKTAHQHCPQTSNTILLPLMFPHIQYGRMFSPIVHTVGGLLP